MAGGPRSSRRPEVPGHEGIVKAHGFQDDGNRDRFPNLAVIDEDFLDGHDNDGDGASTKTTRRVRMFTCAIRYDTPQPSRCSTKSTFRSYSRCTIQRRVREHRPQLQRDRIHIYNRSGHTSTPDRGFRIDMTAGHWRWRLLKCDLTVVGGGEFVIAWTKSDRDASSALDVSPRCTQTPVVPRVTYRFRFHGRRRQHEQVGPRPATFLLSAHARPAGPERATRVQSRHSLLRSVGRPTKKAAPTTT